MRKLMDEGFSYGGAMYQLRVYEDFRPDNGTPDNRTPDNRTPDNTQLYLIFEPRAADEKLFAFNRSSLGEKLHARLGKSFDEVTWLEQAPNGTLREFDFAKTFTSTRLSNGLEHDMTHYDIQEGLERRWFGLKSAPLHYKHEKVVPSMQLSPDKVKELEATLGEKIEPYRERMDREFAQMTGPVTYDVKRNPNVEHEYEL